MPDARTPLPLSRDDWRSRWLVDPQWDVLHRVAEMNWDGEPDEKIEGIGLTVCGQRGFLRMPGIFSRMGLLRCPQCCRLLGLPEGEGAPFNALEGDAADA